MSAVDEFLMGAATSGTWFVFAEFVDQCARAFAGENRPAGGSVSTRELWRPLRRQLIRRMRELGLEGTVITTGGREPLAEHDGALAGHVVIHHRGRLEQKLRVPFLELEVPLDRVDPFTAKWRARMLLAHDLTPLPGIEKTLRGFCGQLGEGRESALLDHVGTWLDSAGRPVLTFEPYAVDNRSTEMAALVKQLDALPLLVDGPHPGIWAEQATLFIVWGDPHEEVLPAVDQRKRERAERELAQCRATSQLIDKLQRRAHDMGLRPLTRRGMSGMIAVPLGIEEKYRGKRADALEWVTERLILHQLAKHDTVAGAWDAIAEHDGFVGRTLRAVAEECGFTTEEWQSIYRVAWYHTQQWLEDSPDSDAVVA